MLASDQPAAIAQATDNQPDVIEIVGARPGQSLKIDRRTYEVKQTPNSAQKDTIQLLRGLPAVTISPDDQILLLGAPNVTVQIDGRATRPELLRTIHGSDIDRIEVITNPSAQYSAQGTGGIINIVLRKKERGGASGTASVEGSTIRNVATNGSVKVKSGKWTYEVDGWGKAGRRSHSSYHKLRTVEQIGGGHETVNTEDGEGSLRDTREGVHAKATYAVDPRTNIVAEAYTGGTRNLSRNDRDFRGLTSDLQSFSERQRVTGSGDPFVQIAAALDHKGKKDGETLKGSSYLFVDPADRRRTEGTFDNGDSFAVQQSTRMLIANAKSDWEHPLGNNRILSMGASWDHFRLTMRHAFVSNGSIVSLGPDTVDQFTGSRSILAAYATFQQPIGSWTVMPGLRLERGSWHISSPSRPRSGRSATNLFPTLHVEHVLTKTLQVTLSYSKQIDRPDPWLLQPYRVVEDALSIRQGNADLRDQSTESFELNLHYHRKSLDAGLILYDREIARVWTNTYSVNAQGINVATIINAGHQRDRGAEFDVSAPLFRRVKVSASVNLFDSRAPIDLGTSGTGFHEKFRYTSNTTLEWDGPQRGKRPGDIAQLQVSTESPSRDFQFHQSARHSITWSYTHSFTPTLSVTATALNVLTPVRYRHRLFAPLVQEDYDSRDEPEFKLKLLKTFGKK